MGCGVMQASVIPPLRREDAAADLVLFDGFEQGLEIAFAEALVALALDEFEEHRADHRVGENLQEDAAAFGGRAVDQDAVAAQAVHILAVAGQAFVDEIGRASCRERVYKAV